MRHAIKDNAYSKLYILSTVRSNVRAVFVCSLDSKVSECALS